MEGFFTLVVIIILINLFNVVIRAIRGGQATPREAPQGKALAEPVSGTEYSYRASAVDFSAETDHHPDYDKHDLVDPVNQYDPDQDPDGSREFYTEKQAAKNSEKPGVSPSLITTGFYRAVSNQDSLVSAFIFHEVFRRPPALRRRD